MVTGKLWAFQWLPNSKNIGNMQTYMKHMVFVFVFMCVQMVCEQMFMYIYIYKCNNIMHGHVYVGVMRKIFNNGVKMQHGMPQRLYGKP